MIYKIKTFIFQTVDPKEIEFQLRITFFDTVNKYFYGSTWLGPVEPPLKSENDRFIVDCEEVCDGLLVLRVGKVIHSLNL